MSILGEEKHQSKKNKVASLQECEERSKKGLTYVFCNLNTRGVLGFIFPITFYICYYLCSLNMVPNVNVQPHS